VLENKTTMDAITVEDCFRLALADKIKM